MNKKSKSKKHKRRDFLRAGLAIGIGSIALKGFRSPGQASEPTESKETIKVLMPDGKLAEVEKELLRTKISSIKPPTGNAARKGIPGRKFVMVIDLGKCANARKCIEGCQKGHHLSSSQEWMTVNLMKDNPASDPHWFPKPCFHCDNPPCVKVCPVGATFKRSDGIVLVDVDRCIGCKFCISACPYSTRIFNWERLDTYKAHDPEYSPETSVPGQLGTVGKCDFCADRSRKGKLPYCASSCPMGAIYFGDMMEDAITNGTETLKFKQTIKDNGGYRFMEQLGTHPRVYYLPAVNRIFPYERGLENLSEERKQKVLDNLSKGF